MNKTNQIKNLVIVIPAMVTWLAFSGNAGASEALYNDIIAKYNNPLDKNGFAFECKTCHVGEYPPLVGDVTLKPNVQDAYNADKTNYTGLVNLLQGCSAGATANPTQPWLCEGGTPNPTPVPTPTPKPTPAPTPTLPIACDDAANTQACLKQANQYGTVGSADSSAETTDVYRVRCGRQTKSLKVSVSDLAPDNPATVSIQAFKGSAKSRISTDSVDGDGAYDPPVRLVKGSGQYLVKIKKSSSDMAGAELYDAQIQCVGDKKAQSTIAIKENQ